MPGQFHYRSDVNTLHHQTRAKSVAEIVPMKVGHLSISQHGLKPLPGIFQPLLVSAGLKDPFILFIGMKIGERLEARLAHGHFSVTAVLGIVQKYLSAFKINFTPFQAELFALPHPSVEGHSERRQLAWTILKDR